MKHISLLFIILVFTSVIINGQEEKQHFLNTKINSATVFLNGAEINRSVSVNIVKGNNLLIFKTLSPELDSKSIRVSTDKDVTLLRISSKINYLTISKELPRISKLKDSLQVLAYAKKDFEDEIDALKIEKQMLLSNKSIGGSDNGVSVDELKQNAEFFRQRIKDINIKTSLLERKTAKYTILSEKYRKELLERNSKSEYKESDVFVLLNSEINKKVNVEIKYFVGKVGWVPTYDIKAIDLNKPIELSYKAKVFNNSSINWKNIDLKLSTADPSLNITKPVLKPWYMNYYSNNKKRYINQNEGYVQNMIMDKISTGNIADAEVNFTEIDVPELSAEFKISQKYSIPADDKPYIVDINKFTLKATYKHFAVTKLDKGVFLLGRITGWQDLNMVDAYANVYFSGTYLGQSLIKTRNVKDTLDFSLGRDEKVIVTRSKLKKYSSKQLLGSKLKETLSYELIAKNNRKIPVFIEVNDQIPISQNSDIEIKIIETSEAKYNSITGKLTWLLNLKPGESKKMRLTFSIKYPKDKPIILEKMKQRKVRMF